MRRLIIKLLTCLCAAIWLVPARAFAEAARSEDGPVIGDGGRISLRNGEISILTPQNWEVYTNIPGLTLLMRAPMDSVARYQRTIQIARFNGPRYLDEFTATEFEALIVRKFSATSATIKNYRIRNHASIEMEDRRPGLLFYSEFTVDGATLMQAHVLVSTQKSHFLITYTDVGAHFEGAASARFMEEAWKIMRSAELRGETPKRFRVTMTMVYILGGLLVILGLLWAIRAVYSGQSLKKDVHLAYDEKTAHLAHDPEAHAWTLPEPQKLKKKSRSSADGDDDEDLMIEDEVS